MSIKFAKSTADFDRYLSSNKYAVAYFTASWCGPCQAIKPAIELLYSDPSGKYDSIEIVKVDIDTQHEVSARYSISSVPTFLFFEDGAIAHKVSGANVQAVVSQLDVFAAAPGSQGVVRSTKRAQAEIAASPLHNEIKALVPPGYEILNTNIHKGEFELLNLHPLYSDKDVGVYDIFQLTSPAGTSNTSSVYTDADSQAILYVPFANISKVYSLLIKTTDKAGVNLEAASLDSDEIDQETQRPSKIRVWANSTSILSFDDATQGSSAAHEESIGEFGENGWYEVKLKFVRFQKVQSLNIFVDGEDEDLHTLIEKIVIVGVNGESRDQGKVE